MSYLANSDHRMSIFYPYVKDFSNSKAVFKLTAIDGSLDKELLHKYTPTPIEGDILSKIACSTFKEVLDKNNEFKVDHYATIVGANYLVIKDIRSFLEENLNTLKPKQSKVYKWLYNIKNNDFKLNNELVFIFKYINSLTNLSDNKEHIKNIIALLTAMRAMRVKDKTSFC